MLVRFVGGYAFVCGTRLKSNPCTYCPTEAERLCDYQTRAGRSCNTPMCLDHTMSATRGFDLCRVHQAQTTLAFDTAVAAL